MSGLFGTTATPYSDNDSGLTPFYFVDKTPYTGAGAIKQAIVVPPAILLTPGINQDSGTKPKGATVPQLTAADLSSGASYTTYSEYSGGDPFFKEDNPTETEDLIYALTNPPEDSTDNQLVPINSIPIQAAPFIVETTRLSDLPEEINPAEITQSYFSPTPPPPPPPPQVKPVNSKPIILQPFTVTTPFSATTPQEYIFSDSGISTGDIYSIPDNTQPESPHQNAQIENNVTKLSPFVVTTQPSETLNIVDTETTPENSDVNLPISIPAPDIIVTPTISGPKAPPVKPKPLPKVSNKQPKPPKVVKLKAPPTVSIPKITPTVVAPPDFNNVNTGDLYSRTLDGDDTLPVNTKLPSLSIGTETFLGITALLIISLIVYIKK